MTNRKVIALLMAFGSWLMQQPQTFKWALILQPFNLGSLIFVLSSVLLMGKGPNDVSPRKIKGIFPILLLVVFLEYFWITSNLIAKVMK